MTRFIFSACMIAAFSIILLPLTGAFAASAETDKMLIEKGQYLVNLGGCNDCHSPKKMTPQGPVADETRLLSGNPANEPVPSVPADLIGPGKWGALTNNHLTGWAGPWGISYAANRSPDPETGTGAWTGELFMRMMRTGKFMGAGRDILPPMPWPSYAKLTDADLKAIFAYLKSLKPVKNQVPAAVPAVPQK